MLSIDNGVRHEKWQNAIQQAEVSEAVVAGDIWEPSAFLCQLKTWKAYLVCERNPDMHSLEAVGILKKATYIEDKYLIYKINNSV